MPLPPLPSYLCRLLAGCHTKCSSGPTSVLPTFCLQATASPATPPLPPGPLLSARGWCRLLSVLVNIDLRIRLNIDTGSRSSFPTRGSHPERYPRPHGFMSYAALGGDGQGGWVWPAHRAAPGNTGHWNWVTASSKPTRWEFSADRRCDPPKDTELGPQVKPDPNFHQYPFFSTPILPYPHCCLSFPMGGAQASAETPGIGSLLPHARPYEPGSCLAALCRGLEGRK